LEKIRCIPPTSSTSKDKECAVTVVHRPAVLQTEWSDYWYCIILLMERDKDKSGITFHENV